MDYGPALDSRRPPAPTRTAIRGRPRPPPWGVSSTRPHLLRRKEGPTSATTGPSVHSTSCRQEAPEPTKSLLPRPLRPGPVLDVRRPKRDKGDGLILGEPKDPFYVRCVRCRQATARVEFAQDVRNQGHPTSGGRGLGVGVTQGKRPPYPYLDPLFCGPCTAPRGRFKGRWVRGLTGIPTLTVGGGRPHRGSRSRNSEGREEQAC